MVTEETDKIIFEPTIESFFADRSNKPLTVICGPNNSGKSLVLKWLKKSFGKNAYMLAVNRFYHVYHFNTQIRDPRELDEWDRQFNQNFDQQQHNFENNFFDLNRVITGLSNQKRESLFSLCGELLGNKISLRKVDQNNDLSMRYIDMDGQNVSVGSTGTRLLITLLGVCMDDRFDVVLIDEPELGLGPKIQQALASFLQNFEKRQQYFPHLKSVILATHSHIFLDRNDLQNNYIVTKNNYNVQLKPVGNISEFHRLQFNLLGNSLENLFFPSAIVIVEGKTDFAYLDKIIQSRFPSQKITVMDGQGDVKKRVNDLKKLLGDLGRNPFRERLFLVMDSVTSVNKSDLVSMGVKEQNIIIWTNNGIEYLYPVSVMKTLFSCGDDFLQKMTISNDVVSLNGISKKKTELSREIINSISTSSIFPEELEKKFLELLRIAIS